MEGPGCRSHPRCVAPIQRDGIHTLSGPRHVSTGRRAEATAGRSTASDVRAGAVIASAKPTMRTLRILALIAVGVSCHLDKLLNGGGGTARPLSHGTPVGLVFSSLPRAPRAGPLGPVQVSVVDSGDQPVAGADSITVTIALANPPGATLRGTPNAQPARGIATFSDLRLDRATSGYALTAAASGLPSVTSDTFTVVPGPAAQLTFTVEPGDVTFFFQAEDGIRDYKVTGVQTCALPISGAGAPGALGAGRDRTGAACGRRPQPGFLRAA